MGVRKGLKKGNDVITFSRKEKVVRFGGKGPYLFGICFRWLEKVWVKMASSMCTSAVVWTMSFVQANNAKSFKLVQSLAIAKTGLYILTQPATDSTKLQLLFATHYPTALRDICSEVHGIGSLLPAGLDDYALLRHSFNCAGFDEAGIRTMSRADKETASAADPYTGAALLASFKIIKQFVTNTFVEEWSQ